MKLFYLTLISFATLSCQDYQTEKNCFEDGKEKKTHYKEFTIDRPEDILRANPYHVKFSMSKDVDSYEENYNNDRNLNISDESIWRKRAEEYQFRFKGLISHFGDQFIYKNIQQNNRETYGIGENQFGYWFLEVKNGVQNAYYLGLSKFTYLNDRQPVSFITGNKLVAYGSFIRISESWGYPFGPPSEAVKDRLVFEIDLDMVRKDTDHDRFNNLFETLILLDPKSSDTDQDGIPDFTDMNPLYKSENSKFSNLYSQIIDSEYENFHFSKNSYFFTGYFSDCDYFQKASPKNVKILIYPEKEMDHLQSDYKLGMFPDYLGRIKKDKQKNKFYINYGSGSGGGSIEAFFINKKWTVKKISTYNI